MFVLLDVYFICYKLSLIRIIRFKKAKSMQRPLPLLRYLFMCYTGSSVEPRWGRSCCSSSAPDDTAVHRVRVFPVMGWIYLVLCFLFILMHWLCFSDPRFMACDCMMDCTLLWWMSSLRSGHVIHNRRLYVSNPAELTVRLDDLMINADTDVCIWTCLPLKWILKSRNNH